LFITSWQHESKKKVDFAVAKNQEAEMLNQIVIIDFTERTH